MTKTLYKQHFIIIIIFDIFVCNVYFKRTKKSLLKEKLRAKYDRIILVPLQYYRLYCWTTPSLV